MQTIKHLMILLVMIFLIHSCGYSKYNFKPLLLCDVSFKFNRCRCRCYDLNLGVTLAPAACLDIVSIQSLGITEGATAWNQPIEFCEKFAGFNMEDWAIEIQPKAKAKADWIKSNCKNAK